MAAQQKQIKTLERYKDQTIDQSMPDPHMPSASWLVLPIGSSNQLLASFL
jgi:hypothetical protein